MDNDVNVADASEFEYGDKNVTGVILGKFQPWPSNVISNLLVEGMENSGTIATVMMTFVWDGRVLDREIEGE